MKKYQIILFIAFLSYSSAFSQEKNTDLIKVTLSGFVKTDFIYDSRETISIREGHFFLYPAPEKFDATGKDINANPNFNILSIQSRVTLKAEGPEILGAKTSSVIEGAFFGHSNPDINGFRLRHAFVKLDWGNSALLVGQYWHPLFIEEVFPDVISFNTGVPFMPFSRNPQIRFSQNFGNVKVSLTAAAQRDFASTGPNGASSEYLRNSSIPIMNLNIKYYSNNLVLGGSVNYQTIKPELQTANNYETDATVNSFAVAGFGKLSVDDFSVKLFGTYGKNLYDITMLGGYGVTGTNPVTGENDFTALKTLSLWTELIYGSRIKAGLFAGYTKNLGADKEINGSVFARGSDINNVFRFAPRVEFNFLPLKFAAEIEYTSAAYGIPNAKYEVEKTKDVSNVRVLTAVYYFFK